MKHIKLFETFVYEYITITPKNTYNYTIEALDEWSRLFDEDPLPIPKRDNVEKPKLNIVPRMNIVERPIEAISITPKNNPKLNIVKKEQMTQEEKLEELNKIIQNYGIFTNHGPMRTYDDYLKYKKENPDFNYPRLDDELNSKKQFLNENWAYSDFQKLEMIAASISTKIGIEIQKGGFGKISQKRQEYSFMNQYKNGVELVITTIVDFSKGMNVFFKIQLEGMRKSTLTQQDIDRTNLECTTFIGRIMTDIQNEIDNGEFNHLDIDFNLEYFIDKLYGW